MDGGPRRCAEILKYFSILIPPSPQTRFELPPCSSFERSVASTNHRRQTKKHSRQQLMQSLRFRRSFFVRSKPTRRQKIEKKKRQMPKLAPRKDFQLEKEEYFRLMDMLQVKRRDLLQNTFPKQSVKAN